MSNSKTITVMKTRKKQQQVSKEDYAQAYCQEKRIRERYAVYIGPETHKRLKNVAFMFRLDHHTTTSSLAEAILARHFEAHKEMLNEEYHRFIEAGLRRFSRLGSDEDGATASDSESYPDDHAEE